MKKLLVGMVVLGLVFALGSVALAFTGEFSADQWFTNHTWQPDTENDLKFEAAARLTGVNGEFNITEKIGVAGSYVFGKSDDFEDTFSTAHAELTNMSIALRYQVVPMAKVQAGFFSGTYTLVGSAENGNEKGYDDEIPKGLAKGTSTEEALEFKMSGIMVGAAVDIPVGNGISIFGEANYAPCVNAEIDEEELKESTMMAFEAGAKYNISQFAVKAGYRYQGFDIKGEDSPLVSSAAFSGFFIGGSVSF